MVEVAQVGRVQTVLLVDDEEDILASLSDLLTSALDGVRVVTASSGREALGRLEAEEVDLIVTDYKMPGMNGFELLCEAAQRAPQVPRMLMTAFPDLDIALRAINEARIDNFFTKPLDPPKIVEVVGEVLSGRRAKAQRDRAMARTLSLLREKAD
ncbi:MAG: response regulator [Euryarchaeota archaeon]|nr:response regulator [Euryarchaeota archaeon]